MLNLLWGIHMPKLAENVVEILLKHSDDEDQEKIAIDTKKITDLLWKVLKAGGMALPVVALGGVAEAYAEDAIRAIRHRSDLKNSMKEIMEDPDIKNRQDEATRYFLTLVKFAPTIATDPMVAKSVVKQMIQWGPEAGYALLKDLVMIEEKAKPVSGKQKAWESLSRAFPGVAPIKFPYETPIKIQKEKR